MTSVTLDPALAVSTPPTVGKPVLDLFTAFDEEEPGSYKVMLPEGCTAEAYAKAEKPIKTEIYRDAKDCLLRLGCRTFGVSLLPKALMLTVSPKAKDKHDAVLDRMLAVSVEGLKLSLDELMANARDRALDTYVATDPTDATAVSAVIASTGKAIDSLRLLRNWIANFDANMAAVKQAVKVVKARDGWIDDVVGHRISVGEWSFMLMSGKGLAVQTVRMADKVYARSLKSARKLK